MLGWDANGHGEWATHSYAMGRTKNTGHESREACRHAALPRIDSADSVEGATIGSAVSEVDCSRAGRASALRMTMTLLINIAGAAASGEIQPAAARKIATAL
jgi:hypothetical protein